MAQKGISLDFYSIQTWARSQCLNRDSAVPAFEQLIGVCLPIVANAGQARERRPLRTEIALTERRRPFRSSQSGYFLAGAGGAPGAGWSVGVAEIIFTVDLNCL